MFLFPFLFIGVIGFIIFSAFKENEKNKNKHTSAQSSGRSATYNKDSGYYNLADEIRNKSGRGHTANTKATSRVPLKPKKESLPKTSSSIRASFTPQSTLVKSTFRTLKPSSMQTVTRGNPLYSIAVDTTSQDLQYTTTKLREVLTCGESISAEEDNRQIVKAMVIGEVLSKPRFRR